LPDDRLSGYKGNGGRAMIGTVTLTYDRPKFLAWCKKRISEQTLKPSVSIFEEGEGTIAEKYIKGITRCINWGCELIILIEDDDYYPKDYIETLHRAWVLHKKPLLIGAKETIYYNIFTQRYSVFTQKHSSAFSTGLSKDALFRLNKNYYDVELWKANGGVQVPIFPVGIKHGFGRCGGKGHEMNLENADKDMNFFKSMVDKEYYEWILELL
jgi:hypothetical protein